jgi:hypothetical protein
MLYLRRVGLDGGGDQYPNLLSVLTIKYLSEDIFKTI